MDTRKDKFPPEFRHSLDASKSLLKNPLLKKWIQEKYLQSAYVKQGAVSFAQLKPFPHLEISDFFIPEKLIEVLKALTTEKFFFKEADLFKFRQTQDFLGSENATLQEFRRFLSSPDFISYLSLLTGAALKSHSIDISATLYEDTDFLLCHDDQLEGRKIAYFIYLSTLEKGDGGTLQLFNKDFQIEASISPRFNTFAFFEVSSKSFHEVAEVLGEKQRIAITGWFHDQ